MRPLRNTQQNAREQQILDLATEMIIKEGTAALTMEKLASKLPFSKGTLYNHFESVEDLLVTLSTQCMDQHRDMFGRASLLAGRPRERFMALGFACRLMTDSPDDELPFVINESLLEEASATRAQGFRQSLATTLGIFAGVVRDGIASGDLDPRWEPEFVSSAVWAVHFGAEDLYRRGVIFPGADIEEYFRQKERIMFALLDGMGWRPLSSELDIPALHERIGKHLDGALHA